MFISLKKGTETVVLENPSIEEVAKMTNDGWIIINFNRYL